MDTVLDYLSQASTWRGVIAVATGAGIVISPDLAGAVVGLGVALVGLIEVLRDERKN